MQPHQTQFKLIHSLELGHPLSIVRLMSFVEQLEAMPFKSQQGYLDMLHECNFYIAFSCLLNECQVVNPSVNNLP